MKIARDLLKAYAFERLTALLNQFFDSEDTWYKKRGYSLSCFKDAIQKLLLREGRIITSTRITLRDSRPRTYTGWHIAADIDHK